MALRIGVTRVVDGKCSVCGRTGCEGDCCSFEYDDNLSDEEVEKLQQRAIQAAKSSCPYCGAKVVEDEDAVNGIRCDDPEFPDGCEFCYPAPYYS